MQFWIIVAVCIILVTIIFLLVTFLPERDIKIMREGRAIEVRVKFNIAKFYIDENLVGEKKISIKNAYEGNVEFNSSVDDLNIKVQVNKGLFRPIVKVFINDEFIDENEYVKNK